MSSKTDTEYVESLKATYKRGWYKKGKVYRFLTALDSAGFLHYRRKSDALKGKPIIYGINPRFDDWFEKAEYVGFDVPFLKSEEVSE